MGQTDQSRYLDAKQSAQRCGVSPSHFYSEIRPHLPAIQIGRRVLFDVADLDAFMSSRKEDGPHATA